MSNKFVSDRWIQINKYGSIFITSLILLYGYGFLFLGAYYSFANAEDISLVIRPRDFGIFQSIQDLYYSYDGRYFTNFLHAINPLVFGSLKWFPLLPVTAIIFLILTTWFFFITVINKVMSGWILLLFSSLIVLVFLSLVPSLPYTLYYMVSSFVYMYPWGFTMLWLAFLIRFLRESSVSFKKYLDFVLCIFFLFCSTGMNEMFLMLNFLILSSLFFYFLFYNRKLLIEFIPVLLIGSSSSLLFVSAPGISNRIEGFGFEEERTLQAYLSFPFIGFIDFIKSAYTWFFRNLILIPLLLLAIPFLNLIGERKNYKFLTFKKVIFFLIMLYGMIFPYYYTMGFDNSYPERIWSSVLFGFIVFLLGLLFVAITSSKKGNGWSIQKFSVFLENYRVFVLLVLFIGLGSSSNIRLLQNEYIDGTLSSYKSAMEKRYFILENAVNEGEVLAIIDTIPVYPKTIFFFPDIYPNRYQSYWNEAYEKYFGLDEVRYRTDTLLKEHY